MDPSPSGVPRTPGTLDAPIELRVPADAGQLSLVRLLVQGMAARADFDLDAIADTVMAVDEACASLLDHTSPELPITCLFRDLGGELRISVSAVLCRGTEPTTRHFGWHVLDSLTESASLRVARPEIGDHPVARIEFTTRSVGVAK
jgi:serine/threonine-protein kinase RsbW